METVDLVKTPLKPKKFIIPFSLLVLDILGLAIVGVGMAEQLGRLEVLPPSWRFNGDGLVLMLAGLGCMLPLFWYVFNMVRQAKAEDKLWFDNLPDEVKKKLEEKIKRESTK